jgi:uncharacterized protein YdhG (YjbR/CyaY superfamily)
VSASEVDRYLAALEEPKRSTLAQLRQAILDVLPEAEQGISYGSPAFKVRGKTIAGFAAFKNHLSYLPHSGSVFPRLHDELEGYTTSSGALRFGIDEPLPVPLVEKLIAVRLQQAFPA